MEPAVSRTVPAPHQVNQLRRSVRWNVLDEDLIALALANSLSVFTIHEDGMLVGFCRIVGDGALKIHFEELMVHPDFQRRGYGSRLVTEAMAHIHTAYRTGCRVRLFADVNRDGFYARFGFAKRRADMPGMEMRL